MNFDFCASLSGKILNHAKIFHKIEIHSSGQCPGLRTVGSSVEVLSAHSNRLSLTAMVSVEYW